MNVKILKIDLKGVEMQLSRIADALEGLRESTNPIHPNIEATIAENENKVQAFYTNEDEEIVAHKLALLGRIYKPRTPPKS